MREIKDVILENRRKVNMTQEELANKLNVTNKVISNWENGRSYPDVLIIPELARALEININEFFGEEINRGVLPDNNNHSNKTVVLKFKNYMILSSVLAICINIYLSFMLPIAIIRLVLLGLAAIFMLASIVVHVATTLSYGEQVIEEDPSLYLSERLRYINIMFFNIFLASNFISRFSFLLNIFIFMLYCIYVFYIIWKSKLKLKFESNELFMIILGFTLYIIFSIPYINVKLYQLLSLGGFIIFLINIGIAMLTIVLTTIAIKKTTQKTLGKI